MSNGEIYFQDLAKSKLRRVESNFHRFRVPSCSRTNCLVVSGFLLAAREPGNNSRDAFQMIENRFHSPETPASQYCRLCAASRWNIDGRIGEILLRAGRKQSRRGKKYGNDACYFHSGFFPILTRLAKIR